MLRALLAAACVALAGCAGTEHFGARVSKELQVEAGASAGLLLGSLGFGAPNAYLDLELHFRRRGDREPGSIRISQGAARPGEIETTGEGGRRVTIFAVPLPPGEYEFFTYLGFAPGSGDANYARPRVDFSIPFAIAAGRTTYVGEYIVESRPQMRSTGRLVAEAKIIVADRLERDLAAAKEAGRPVAAAPSLRAVPDMRRLNLPNFVAREL
ncbi:MAG TPA: hypothetical protein VF876_18960 [Burkholderiales bacterium]